MPDTVKIIECPRDAWQGLHKQIPPAEKADYLRKLIAAGFTPSTPSASSRPLPFRRWPTLNRCSNFSRRPSTSRSSASSSIKKARNAPSPPVPSRPSAFLTPSPPNSSQRNQHQTLEESLDAFESIVSSAHNAGLDTVAYISMAFGNPYGEPWNTDEVVTACELLIDSGATAISLADTVGLASPAQIADTVGAVLSAHRRVRNRRPSPRTPRRRPRSHSRRLGRGLPPLRCRPRRSRWLSLRARRARRQHPHRNSARDPARARREGSIHRSRSARPGLTSSGHRRNRRSLLHAGSVMLGHPCERSQRITGAGNYPQILTTKSTEVGG